jgi:hypothetical protein
MKIRKEHFGYYIGSKFYTIKDFAAFITMWVMIALSVIALIVVVLFSVADNARAKKIATSEDPVGNLIIALEEEPDWAAARRQLDKIGDPLLVALAPACANEAVGGSHFDPATPGPHPFVVLNADGTSYEKTYTFLNQWGPVSRQPDEVQLVICIYDGDIVIQSCNYNGGAPIKRVQSRVFLYIVDAATGKTYEQKTFTGSTPGKCPNATSSGGKTIKGGPVDYSEVNAYLQNLYD